MVGEEIRPPSSLGEAVAAHTSIIMSVTIIIILKQDTHSLPCLFHVFCLREGEFLLGFLRGVAFGVHGALLAQDGLGEAEQKPCFSKNNC